MVELPGLATAAASVGSNGQVAFNENYKVGTLQYTKAGLFAVFSWVLWGDLCFQLFESAGGPGILGLYLQDNFHVSNVQINILFNLIPQLIGVVMTPVISFKSDRTRSRWGRRIPYMALTAPFMCMFAVAIGFSDEIVDYFKSSLAQDSFITPFTAAMLVIGFLTIGFTFFNEFVGTVYWYLFADVVPQHFLGRFMGLFRMVGFAAGLLTSAFIVPYQLTHIKAIHVGIALLYFFGFGLMCWRVKEGQYPPVTDVTKKTPFLTQVKIYFKQSFTHPIFIWFYIMSATTVLTRGLNPAGVFGLHVSQHQSSIEAVHAEGSGCLASTPDGKFWVSGGNDGLIKFWDGADPKSFRLLKTFPGQEGPVHSVAITADGKMIVAGLWNGRVSVWDTTSDQPAKVLSGHDGAVQCVALSKDGRRLVSAGADSTVRVWDLVAGNCLKTLSGHQGAVHSVALSTNADRIASGGADKKIVVWDAEKGTPIKTLEGSPGPVYAVSFAPAIESKPQQERGFFGRSYHVVAGYFKDVFTNESLYDIPPDTKTKLLGEDLWVISGGQDGGTDEKNAIVRIWDTREGRTKPDGKPEPDLVRQLKGHKKAITSVMYKPDIRMILTGSKDGIIRIWDPAQVSALAGDQSYKTYSGYTKSVTALACQTTGKYAANLSVDGSLHVWNLDEGISLYKNGMSGMFFNVVAMLLAYPLGALVDRWHPIRIVLWTQVFLLPFIFASYWVIQDYTSSFWLNVVRMPITNLAGAASMPLMVMLLPRVKYGQMCSANALVRQLVAAIAGLLGAMLMDQLTRNSLDTDNFRYGFLFQGAAGVLTLVTLIVIYRQWKQLGGNKYVAPEA